MQLSFKEHFQLFVFQKLWDWRLEKFCMKNHTYLLDHQRSHWDTITIGPEGIMNWVLQLNNSQSVNSFNSLVEKFNMQNSPNQPNQNPNQSVIDRGNLRTQKICLLLKVKRPVPTRSMINVCTKNLVLQIDRWNLRNCLKTSVLSMLTMEQNLWSKTAQVHTQWKRTICSWRKSWHCVIQRGQRVQPCNQREEHWLQHSRSTTFCSETITWRQRSKFDQKIENHPQRHALQNDLQQHRQFNPFSKESRDVIKAAGNTELCELLDVEHKAQCKVCLSYWDVGIVYCTCGHFLRDDTKEHKKYIMLVLDLFRFPTTTSEKVDPTVTATGRKKGITSTSSRISSKRNARRENSWAFTIVSSVMQDSERLWSKWVALKKWFVRWTNWRTRVTHTTLLKKESMYTVRIGGSVRILLVATRCP